jgi:TolA-binding protein
MTRSSLLAPLPLLTALLFSARPTSAQARDSAAPRDSAAAMAAIRDSLFQRARRLVLAGDGAAGRAIVDSLVQATSGTPAEGEALYWRAALASTAADAERDYRRVIVEHPFSPHLGDALYALAQLEMARGDRASAADHLQRFLLERPSSTERGRAGLLLGRLLLDQNEMARGCAVLTRTREALGIESAELRNQVDYYASRCTHGQLRAHNARDSCPRRSRGGLRGSEPHGRPVHRAGRGIRDSSGSG